MVPKEFQINIHWEFNLEGDCYSEYFRNTYQIFGSQQPLCTGLQLGCLSSSSESRH